ncbi:wax ester/triacylglycerol synthase family O-acyltransferase [Mycolicibacterium hodleri]|nr:wax ester/triacylglycerol synthase family O-acyltransferase [Mycolicibacterium hodleri]
MQRLSATDAMMLYQEQSSKDHGHSMRVILVDPPKEAMPRAWEQIRDNLVSALNQLPLFWCRLVPTPLSLHHPLWVPDPHFHVYNHFHRVGCPSPGGERELADLVADIASRPLDRTRPLWEMWIVEGLASGGLAVVSKMHHALADGVATVQMFAECCTTEPRSPDEQSPRQRPTVAPIPSNVRLLTMAARDVLKVLPTVPTVWRRARQVRRLRGERATVSNPPQGTDAQPTSLNRNPGPYRNFAHLTFDLNDIKTIKNAFGVSINDVYLAICTTSVRSLLLERDELPEVPLIGGVAASTRTTAEQQDTYGNRVATMAVRLPTGSEDPVQRLMDIKAEADIAKADFRMAEGARLGDILELLPPPVHHLILAAVNRLTNAGRPVVGNVILSNVPGPQETLYFGEFKIKAIYGVGPLLGGIGLNITAWSYVDQLHMSVLSNPETIPDPWPFVQMAQDAFDELHKRANTLDQRGTDG